MHLAEHLALERVRFAQQRLGLRGVSELQVTVAEHGQVPDDVWVLRTEQRAVDLEQLVEQR